MCGTQDRAGRRGITLKALVTAAAAIHDTSLFCFIRFPPASLSDLRPLFQNLG